MPDPNKLAALAAAGFQVRQTCFTCIHAVAPQSNSPSLSGGQLWFYCGLIKHEHEKHGRRDTTGVPSTGWCPSWAPDAKAIQTLSWSGYDRFMEKETRGAAGQTSETEEA